MAFTFQSGATTYQFADGGTAPAQAYTGSGTPWTSESTTPFELANNPVTGEIWRPIAATIAGNVSVAPGAGGVPAIYLADEPDPVEEIVPIQIRGTTLSNAMLALRSLKQFLFSTHVGQRVQLSVAPQNVSQRTIFEILAATVQELPQSVLGAEHTTGVIRAEIRMIRRAFGGIATGAETVINAASITNTTASCITSMAATEGDLINAGQPMNLTITPSATQARFYLASIAGRATDTTGFSATSVPTGVGWTTIGTATLDIAALFADPLVVPRLIVRASCASSTMSCRVLVYLNTGSTAIATIGQYTSGPYAAWTLRTTVAVLDFGDLYIPLPPAHATTATLTVVVQATHTIGSSTNATVNSVELLFARTFCVIDTSVTSGQSLRIAAYPSNTTYNRAFLPLVTPLAGTFSGTEFVSSAPIIGAPPKAYGDGSLWIAMATATTGVYDAAHTATITGTNAPLSLSFRR